MKTFRCLFVTPLACLCLILVLTGCRASDPPDPPSRPLAGQEHYTCPICGMQTRTAAIKDITYTQCICPSCGQVRTLDPTERILADLVHEYVGDDISNDVQVCDNCKAVVALCRECREKAREKAAK